MTENEPDQILAIAIAVCGADRLEDIIRSVVRRVGELVPCDRATLALKSDTHDVLQVRDINQGNNDGKVLEVGKEIPISEDNALGWAMLHGKPHVRNTAAENGNLKRFQQSKEAISHVLAPVSGREEAFGVLGIGAFKEHAYDENDVKIIAQYARLVGLAIENLRNFERARELSIRDGLTRCFNHRHFNEVLAIELGRIKRYGGELSLIMMDIDHFKCFNDDYGHQAGDQVLVQTVKIIERFTRSSDLLFRYGGEEFCLLLPGTDLAAAADVAKKLLAAFREHNHYQPDRSLTIPVRLSMGIASAPEHTMAADGLIGCADQALYKSKDAGRDTATVFDESGQMKELIDSLASGGGQSARGGQMMEPMPLDEHSRRVAYFSELMGAALNIAGEQLVNLRIAAYFHDLGEATIPEDVMNKSGALDHHERELVKTHPVVGEGILRRSIKVPEILAAVLHHHERYDGTGYPEGLAGENIPLLARILAIAEVFDALISERPYRKPVPLEEAYRILRETAGYQLDPNLVEKFIAAHQAAVAGPGVVANI